MEDRQATGGAATKVRVNGTPAEATLSTTTGGCPELRWRCAGATAERSLSLEADVLGAEASGKEVVVRAFVADDAARPPSCAKAGGKRRRREYVFEMPDGEGAAAAAAWGETLRGCLDSFGTCLWFLRPSCWSPRDQSKLSRILLFPLMAFVAAPI